MFQNSLALVDDAGLTLLHVFPYSPRPGTPAARMPQLPRPVIKARAARLRQKGAKAQATRLDAMTGSRQTLLVEKSGPLPNQGIGRAPCFTPVCFDGDARPGSFVSVTITGRQGEQLAGRLA
jgi:threonylcarbamoyladenosine tRNA methylthiotransferase MtaB